MINTTFPEVAREMLKSNTVEIKWKAAGKDKKVILKTGERDFFHHLSKAIIESELGEILHE